MRLFRTLGFVAILGIVQLPFSATAHADFWGGDLPLLAGILAEAISTVSNLVNTVATLKQELSATETMLSKLDPSSIQALLDFLRSADLTYEEMTRGIDSLGFTLLSVNGQFHAIYRDSYAGMSVSDHDAIYARWEDEVLASAQVAARSQSTLSMLQQNADRTAQILNMSAGNSGVVGQLQAVVQLLGVISRQNNTLIHSLVTTGRVIETSAAATASDQRLSREKKKQNLEGYRDRGPDVPPMVNLP